MSQYMHFRIFIRIGKKIIKGHSDWILMAMIWIEYSKIVEN